MLDSLSSTETQIDGAYAGVAVCKHKDRHVIHVEMEETGAKRETTGRQGDTGTRGQRSIWESIGRANRHWSSFVI
ncbi:hypothetical protein CesoFtcFv8_022702 [Champsocephalus esox]|uniref:Uncharacterized protein n=1 Tax=Champsocephalus esox TaxID=159716 RepID=A0AAN8B7A5_9TELE|nr:hypothetical protein CesoFtcFv8_022702 [Champsocephalus esox]